MGGVEPGTIINVQLNLCHNFYFVKSGPKENWSYIAIVEWPHH